MRYLLVALLTFMVCCARPEPQRPVADLTIAHTATVYIVHDAGELGAFAGTGWFVDDYLVVTAGHVCMGPGTLKMALTSGAQYDATVVGALEHPDVCLLRVAAPAPAKLTLAKETPTTLGTRVWYVGYPSHKLALHDGRVAEEDGDYLVVSIDAWFGASGSALLNERGEVVGLLSALGAQNGSTTLFVPVEQLAQALALIQFASAS